MNKLFEKSYEITQMVLEDPENLGTWLLLQPDDVTFKRGDATECVVAAFTNSFINEHILITNQFWWFDEDPSFEVKVEEWVGRYINLIDKCPNNVITKGIALATLIEATFLNNNKENNVCQKTA